MYSVHVPEFVPLVHDRRHETLEPLINQVHLVDWNVLKVDGDGGLGVQQDVGVDVGGQRLGQLHEVLLEGADGR